MNFLFLLLGLLISIFSHSLLGFVFSYHAKDFTSMLMMVMTYSFIFTIPSALFQFGILFKADFWRYVLLISPTQASTYMIESGLVKDFKLEAGLSFGILITLTVLGYFFYIYPKYKHYAVKQSGGVMMFKRILLHEIKGILRDKMYMFFMLYPLILVLVSLWLVPYLKENASELVANIVVLVFIMMTAFIYGAVTGFTLLDDQDDQVLYSLRITPIKVSNYILIKLGISYLFGLTATLLVIFVTNFLDASILDIFLIAILSSLQAPIVALLVNAFASNKVEGFVVMKGSGLILLIPVAAIFITNWTELLLGIVPGFWVARMVSISLIPADYLLSTYVYFLIGIVINLLFITLLYKKYTKRIGL